jgi:hypothetical protein
MVPEQVLRKKLFKLFLKAVFKNILKAEKT